MGSPCSENNLSKWVISYLLSRHRDDLTNILRATDSGKHYAIHVHFLLLMETHPEIGMAVLKDAEVNLAIMDVALVKASRQLYLLALELQENETADNYGDERINEINRQQSSVDAANDERRETEALLLKKHLHFRIIGLPYTATHPHPRYNPNKTNAYPRTCNEKREGTLPKPRHFGMFLSVSGIVVKCGITKIIESRKNFRCDKCGNQFQVLAEFEKSYAISPPKGPCWQNGRNATLGEKPERFKCRSNKFEAVDEENDDSDNIDDIDANSVQSQRRDFQEIKIQEHLNEQFDGSIPYSLLVILENELVGQCQPGDDVTVTGMVKYRWSPLIRNERCNIELAMKANSIQIHNKINSITGGVFRLENPTGSYLDEQLEREFRAYWTRYNVNPLRGRNFFLQSFCPQIKGYYYIKLATAIVLAGGVERLEKESGSKVRGQSHMLLVGDPGIAKSQILKFVSKLSPRSIFTTGIGSSGAGLTASAVKEGGQWYLEAGALVLADGGVCCIDEFTTMLAGDRAAIHEAMEQQTISVAKAGIVCKLNARCSILAACNAKGGSYYDTQKSLNTNCGLEPALLSRFDLVFVLLDTKDREKDSEIARHILNEYRILPASSTTENDDNVLIRRTEELPEHLTSNGNDESHSNHEQRSAADGNAGFWTFERMRSYLTMVKTLTPMLKPAARQIISTYYEKKRQESGRNPSRTCARMLESLIRLAQGHARLSFRKQVEMTDALVAVQLMEISLGQPNGEWPHTSIPDDPTLEQKLEGKRILDQLGLQYEELEIMENE